MFAIREDEADPEPDSTVPPEAPPKAPRLVRSVQFSTDSKLIATAGSNGGWVVETNGGTEPPPSRGGGTEMVLAGEGFSPNLRRVVTRSTTGRLRVFDTTTGKVLSVLTERSSAGALAAWTSDGRNVPVSLNANDLQLFDASSGRSLEALRHFEQPIFRLQFSPQGDVLLVTLGHEQPERVVLVAPKGKPPRLDRLEGMREASWTGHQLDWVGTREPLSLLFSTAPDTTRSANLPGNLATLSPDGRRLLTVRLARDCRLYALPEVEPWAGPTTLTGSDRWCALGTRGLSLYTANPEGGILVWDIPRLEPSLPAGPKERISAGRVPSPDKTWQAVISDVGHLTIENSTDPEVVAVLSRRLGTVASVQWSEDGHTLTLHGLNGRIELLPWDPPTKPDAMLHDLVGCIGGSWFSEDGVLQDLAPSERIEKRQALAGLHTDDPRWEALVKWLLHERFESTADPDDDTPDPAANTD
ncbi:MAG: hypothetical protein QOE70_1244 [Chthoniobacter sp.]|nr:hypothetical protein [Chthoniobacter sp.]